jgi:tRNA A-37 threonylcarbamoyl transferase component Bud32
MPTGPRGNPLLPGDDWIVARDPWIPGLPLVLDDDRLSDHVRTDWCAPGPAPDRVDVRYLRYKPGTQVLADLLLSWRSHERHALLVATSSAAAAKLTKQRRHAHDEGQPMLVEDPDRLLLVVPAEADRHLPGCHRLHDRVGWLDRSLKASDVHVLAYKPHRRLVARIDRDGTPVGVLKVHHPSMAAGAITALRWAEEQRCTRVRLPQLRGVDDDAATVLTDWTPGTALDQQKPEHHRSTLRGVGKQLGRIHQLEPGSLTPTRASSHHRALVQGIIRLRPDLAVHAERALRPVPSADPTVPVHGDLSPDQVIHGDDGVTLIDLDRTGIGSAAADLASWVAATLVTTDPSTSSAELPDALWEGYDSVGGPATPDQVTAHLPEQLLRRAGEPFRLRHRDWPARMEALVLRAERLTSLTGAT